MTAIERQRELLAATETWTAWLIERGQLEGQEPTLWYRSERWGLTTGGIWTTDAYSADMFSTREEAEAVIDKNSHLPSQFGRAVEHGFVNSTAQSDRAALLDVVEAALDVDGLWTAESDDDTDILWQVEAGDALEALRAALDRLHALPGWEE